MYGYYTFHCLDLVDSVLDDISMAKGCGMYKDYLKLKYIENYNNAEISVALGYSRKTNIHDILGKGIKTEALKVFAIGYFGHRAL